MPRLPKFDLTALDLRDQLSDLRIGVERVCLHSIESDFRPENADTFRRELLADYVLANPPSTTPTGSAKTKTCAGSSAQIPVCFWFLVKSKHDDKLLPVSELEPALPA